MALIDRLETDLPNHEFSWALALWAFGDLTRAQVISGLNDILTDGGFPVLSAADEAGLDEIAAHYSSQNNNDKNKFRARLESAHGLLKAGRLTKTFVANMFGLT